MRMKGPSLFLIRRRRLKHVSPTRRAAVVHAALEPVTNPAGTNAQRIWRDAEPRREAAAVVDLHPLGAPVVFEDERAFGGRQLAEAPIQALPIPLALQRVRIRWWIRRTPRRVAIGCRPGRPMFRAAKVFKKDELRDDVTVVRRRGVRDPSFFVETPGDAIQRIVRQRVRVETAFAGEIPDQPPAHVEILLAAGIDALVEPLEHPLPRLRCQLPVSLELRRD